VMPLDPYSQFSRSVDSMSLFPRPASGSIFSAPLLEVLGLQLYSRLHLGIELMIEPPRDQLS
jgi:hypothetical protein